jgi:peroxiredoxin
MKNLCVLIAGAFCLTTLGDNTAIRIGATAPPFTLQDQSGANVTLRQYVGKIVVLEWFDPECDYAKRDAAAKTNKNLATKYAEKGVVWIGVNSTRNASAERNKTWIKDNELPYSILTDSNQAVAGQFGVTSVPYYVIVDKNGNFAYAGMADDDDGRDAAVVREGKKLYVDQALDEMTSGKTVSIPASRTYGCPLQ